MNGHAGHCHYVKACSVLSLVHLCERPGRHTGPHRFGHEC